MPFPHRLSRALALQVGALLLCVWLCAACAAGSFIIPPGEAHAEVAPLTSGECDMGALLADVTTNGTRLRSAPNLESTILRLLRPGEVHSVAGFDPDGSWVQLRVEGISQPAWVYAELVEFSCAQPVPLAAAAHRETAESEILPAFAPVPVEQFLQTLAELETEPESDGGRLYARALYVPETAAAAALPCDGPCAVIQDSRLADGSWFLPYESRYTFDRSGLKAVHLLPLYELHRSGGWNWAPEKQTQYGAGALERGPDVWALFSLEMLAARGFADPGIWLPEAGPGRCAYVMDWIGQKALWRLSVDPREKEALTAALSNCHDISLIPPSASLLSTPDPTGTETVSVQVECHARAEVVSIVNRSGEVLNLQNWHLHDEGNRHRFQLPHWPLGVDGEVSLGFGQAAADIQLTAVPVWNNYGDTVYLYDDNYNLIVVQPCVI